MAMTLVDRLEDFETLRRPRSVGRALTCLFALSRRGIPQILGWAQVGDATAGLGRRRPVDVVQRTPAGQRWASRLGVARQGGPGGAEGGQTASLAGVTGGGSSGVTGVVRGPRLGPRGVAGGGGRGGELAAVLGVRPGGVRRD
jgi:hypothetical protein